MTTNPDDVAQCLACSACPCICKYLDRFNSDLNPGHLLEIRQSLQELVENNMSQNPEAPVRRKKGWSRHVALTKCQADSKGCNNCRPKKVKCDERRPKCSRCARLHLSCSWPMLELRLQAIRRGSGSWRSREGRWSPRPMLPAPNVGANFSSYENYIPSALPSESELVMDLCPLPDEWWATMGVDQEGLNWPTNSNCADDLFLPSNSPSPDLNALDEIFSSIDAEMIASVGLGSALPQSLSDFHIPLANSMVLSSKEHHALEHWQTTFSIYRTTKNAKWSTHKLLLDLGSYNIMIMHLILAVSINDVCHRQENAPASQEAQNHFDAGARELIKTIENSRRELRNFHGSVSLSLSVHAEEKTRPKTAREAAKQDCLELRQETQT